MPANNVNCEALRLVTKLARRELERLEAKRNDEHQDEVDGFFLGECDTAIWMLERHVRKFDEANG